VEAPGTPLHPQRPAARRRQRWLLLAGAVVIFGGAYIAVRGARPGDPDDSPPRRVLYYVDPMHPAYRSDRPGKAPDCGMDLVAVYDHAAAPLPAGTIDLTASQEQAAHFQTETVRLTPTPRQLHTVGRVMADESRTYRVSAGTDGWVRRVFSDQTGTRVKRGDRLSTFFARDISAPQQAYIFALDGHDRLMRTPSPGADEMALAEQQLTTTIDNLRFLGMGDAQIEELARTRREVEEIDITAPADGQILERRVAAGQRFARGDLLYTIADLTHVWVLADVYAGDTMVSGDMQTAQIAATGMAPMPARVAAVPAQFDEQGRSGKVRLELDNPHGVMVPGLIVDVTIAAAAQPVITVPADAVLESGTSSRVFVAAGSGRYELREVTTGWRQGDRVEIRSGLRVGDRVVTSGAFLLDSETRMRTPSPPG